LVQACCAAGGVAGLVLGFVAALGQASDPRFASALAAVLVPVGLHVVAGVLAGAFAAWLLLTAIRAVADAVSGP